MPKDDKSEVKRVETTTHSKVLINGEQRKGLIATTTVKYESSRDGVEGQWDSLLAVASLPSKPIRQILFEQLDMIEQHAQNIAKQDGFKGKSTLEVIKKVEEVDGVVTFDSTYVAGLDSEPGSLLRSAYLLERRAKDVRDDIEQFENQNTNTTDQDLFYNALSKSLRIASQMMFITVRRNEQAILRGNDASYNHDGAKTRTQREAVERIEHLTTKNKPLGKTAAVTQVAGEYQKATSTIFGWLKKFGK